MQSAVLTLFKSHKKTNYFTIIHNNMILDNNKTHPWTPPPPSIPKQQQQQKTIRKNINLPTGLWKQSINNRSNNISIIQNISYTATSSKVKPIIQK